MNRSPACWLAILSVLAASLGPWVDRSEAAGPGGRAEPPGLPVIVDDDGQQVGVVFTLTRVLPLVRLRADGRDAALGVFANRLFAPFADARYESPDCTGPPWIVELSPGGAATSVAELAAIGRPNVLLVANGDPESRTFGSFWNPSASPPVCGSISSTPTIARPTRVLLNLNQFRAPFRFR